MPIVPPPPAPPSLGSRVAGAIGSGINAFGKFTGANAIGEGLGTAAYNIGQLTQGKTNLDPVNVPKMAGGILQAGATVAGLGAAPATLAGTIATGAGVGAAQMGGGTLAQTGDIKKAAVSAGEGSLLGGATAGAVAGIGHLIGAIGDKIMTSVIKPSRADIADGFNIQTVKDYNLGGSLNTTLDKTQEALNNLTTQLHQKLASSPTAVSLSDVVNQTISELTDASKLKGFGANTKIANTLQQLKSEAGIVAENGTLSIPDAQVVKQAAGNFGAWQYGKPDPESKATEIVYNTFYNKLKTAIEQASPAGVKGINQQLSKLIPVQNAVLRRLPVADRAGLISLNDMIGLVGSTVHPAALGPTILNLISKSGAAGSLLSKIGPRASRLAVPAATGISAIGSQVKRGLNTTQ